MSMQLPVLDHMMVVAGGSGERLGGIDKALSVVGGVRLIDRALAVPVTGRRVVVRPPGRSPIGRAPDGSDVEVVTERPLGGGPAAGLVAGFGALTARSSVGAGAGTPRSPERDRARDTQLIGVAAADHLGAVDAVFAVLAAELTAAPGYGVAVAAPGGNAQWLTAVWRADALREAVAAFGDPQGAPARRLVALGRPVMIEVARVPSLDHPSDLVEVLTEGRPGLAVGGHAEHRDRVVAKLSDCVSWTATPTVDPDGHDAVLLAPPGATAATDVADRGQPAWVYVVAPDRLTPTVPAPTWAGATLAALPPGEDTRPVELGGTDGASAES